MLTRQLLPVFGDQPIDSIERTAVNRWFDSYSMTAPGGANKALGLLHQIMNRAMVHGHVQTNPASAIRRNPERRMTRFLSRDETARLHAELARSAFPNVLPARRRRTSSACCYSPDVDVARSGT